MWSLETRRGQQVEIPALPAVVGSDDGADVRLRHASIAPRHARLLPNGGHGLRVDALDDAVVTVGGRRVRRATLEAGDEVVLGGLSFTLRQQIVPGSDDPLLTPGPRPSERRHPSPPSAPERTTAYSSRSGASRSGPSRSVPARAGLLHADFSQLAPGTRLVLGVVLLTLAALLVYAVQALVAAAA